ncbi:MULTISPECIES: AMP-binding protein [Burkholderia]|uniref:Acyl-CoA synthetase (AMP-forming)/AMP-acid ligase II n=1 Tax=Burkholderia pyrrocinia TaxID=60550 RepID=A0A318J0U3_BURPY|nr:MULTISPECIES: AMP-binding protein [Burkholderia]PXX41215.1 acyl-CoA synthetase (AMP-forming)/AMP-acid ligase II [Burkholderia pyrrocinia]SFW59346.1 Acyl-CoA synthetase (AMP-forming)/AMP-acid ligase II [Burkholderia sp. NFACC33-1]SFY14048.1 Acyl-CoA synthetase (AMP-forming)/AMP-acid ligase II [Burkholderia sp. NFPP32]
MTPESIVEVLQQHAASRPNQLAMQHYDAHLEPIAGLTYGDLVVSMQKMAARLADRVRPGDTALVAMKYGIDYLVALLAILSLGGVAIPGMPANRRSSQRLEAMLRVGQSVAMLHDGLNDFTEGILARHDVHALDLSAPAQAGGTVPPVRRIPGEAAALLQFTSGSTATPKGVLISHANIVANQIAIAKHFGHRDGLRLLGWLPLFHDMGLIGNVLQPLFLGGTALMQSPLDVVSKPASWLKLIERTRAHTSGGPNFIYDMCVRRVSADEAASLDLSAWETAYNGSEPVRRHTLERFAEKFRASGFRATSIFPCYGMAEASLFVSGHRFFGTDGDTAAPATDSTGTLVSCGPIDAETTIVVADPVSLAPLDDGSTGEIFISGPSVASAYRDECGIRTAPFAYRFAAHEGRLFHRTGDLGKIERGQLFVTGRRKDTIKIRGVTYHAEDVESIIERECPQIDDHTVCIVGLPAANGDETVAAVVEISRTTASSARSTLVSQIREAVSLHAGVSVARVCFVLRGSLSRTSSGKFIRSLCRESLVDGSLAIIDELQEV